MYNVLFIIGWIIYFSFTVACPVTVIYSSIKNWPARTPSGCSGSPESSSVSSSSVSLSGTSLGFRIDQPGGGN